MSSHYSPISGIAQSHLPLLKRSPEDFCSHADV